MIPVCEPLIGQREIELVNQCLASGWVSSAGRFIDAFEDNWAAYCGMAHGVSVCNGTAALHVAVGLLDLQPGDEVILPTFTIISCAQAITAWGGVPVLVDSDPVTWQMDIDQVAANITARTKAIMAVHTYGHPVDMDPLAQLASRYGLVLIEDAAEAHGALYKGRRCGGLGDISVFSFYANKLITTGEGGMVLCRRTDWAEKARGLRNLGFGPGRRFHHEQLGFNYRMTNLQAAMGVAQMERLDQIVKQKRAIAKAYHQRLEGLDSLRLAVEAPWATNIYWVVGLVLNDPAGPTAEDLAGALKRRGVDTRPFFLGMHAQPAFQSMGLFAGQRYPVADNLARMGLYLPNGLTITEAQIAAVCAAVRAELGDGGRYHD